VAQYRGTETKGPTVITHRPSDRFVCDSPAVVDRPDYTTRGQLDHPTGGWVATHDAATDTYVARYPAMSNRPRTYRRI